MTSAEAELSIQQVVYTLQAAFEDPTLAVQFRTESNPIDQVFGVPTSEPLAAAPQLDVLSLVSISDPGEGRVVSGTFTAQGRASSFEGNVPWRLRAEDGTVVREGFATAGMEDHLVDVGDRADRRLGPGAGHLHVRGQDRGRPAVHRHADGRRPVGPPTSTPAP